MKLHYFRSKHGNFGDDLNSWIWPELLPGLWDDGADGITFVGIGTILNRLVPDNRLKVVLGSGVGYAPLPPDLHDGSWNILAVRGPLSARAAGLPEDTAITDGAILLSVLPGLAKPPEQRTGGVAFVPHVSSAEAGGWEDICARLGFTYIDPRWDFRKVFALIGNASLVLADAMHGAIVADTFRVPFVPLVSSREISSFKWMDWTLSMDLPYRPIRLPASSTVEAVRDRLTPLTGRQYLNDSVLAPETRDGAAIADRLIEQLQADIAARGEQRLAAAQPQCDARLAARPASLPRPALSKGALRGFDERCRDRATEALRRAAVATSYLSDDRIFANRRERMVEKVEVARLLAERVDA